MSNYTKQQCLDEITKVGQATTNIKNAIINKGVSVPDTTTLAEYPDKIASIPVNTITTPASPIEITENGTTNISASDYGADGMTEVTIKTNVSSTPNLQELDLKQSPGRVDEVTYTPDEGYDGFSKVNLYLSDYYYNSFVIPTNKLQTFNANSFVDSGVGFSAFRVGPYDIDTEYSTLSTLVGSRSPLLASWTGGNAYSAIVDGTTLTQVESPLKGDVLSSISFYKNTSLTSIDSLVSKDLTLFNVANCSSLSSLPDGMDLSQCTEFRTNYSGLTSLNVTLPAVTTLYIGNMTKCVSMNVVAENITTFPTLSGNTALTTVELTVPMAKAASSTLVKNTTNITSIKLDRYGYGFKSYYAAASTAVNALNLSYCTALTDDAVSALIDSLYDISVFSLPVTVSITLEATVYSSLSETTISKATAKGWTLASA